MRKAANVFGYLSIGFNVLLGILMLLSFENNYMYQDYSIALAVIALVPLAWQIPFVIKLYNYSKNNEEISITFKVCYLLFVNLIGGIMLLCEDSVCCTNSTLTGKLMEVESLRNKRYITQEEYSKLRSSIIEKTLDKASENEEI